MQRFALSAACIATCLVLGSALDDASVSCGPNDDADECSALCELWTSSGKKFADWCNGEPLCSWSGLNCTDGRLVQIMIPHTNQTGTIPESIGKLSKLESLLIGNNPYTGTIPSTLGLLTNLKVIGLDRTHLTGTIPHSISSLVNLEQMVAFGNTFSGSLPNFGNLTKLTSLGLFSDGLTSWTDDALCSLVKAGTLTECGLSGNPFVCPIPSCASACGATCSPSIALV